jgi:hypothetical protein
MHRVCVGVLRSEHPWPLKVFLLRKVIGSVVPLSSEVAELCAFLLDAVAREEICDIAQLLAQRLAACTPADFVRALPARAVADLFAKFLSSPSSPRMFCSALKLAVCRFSCTPDALGECKAVLYPVVGDVLRD